jgi:rhodanese-related sulfurtransferase
MSARSISPKEAFDLLQSRTHTYLDVRSVPEFAQGHPRDARNVPYLQPDPASGRMLPNPEFLEVMKANFPPETPILVGCLSGGRSMAAAEELLEAGYTDVTNVRCGFGGTRDRMGRVVEPGWAELGLPVEREAKEGESYETLRRRARS